jgi:DNA-binding response OmpR family regulator
MSSSDLIGRRILVVEDDYDQAQEMARLIEKHGGEVIGPFPQIQPAFLALEQASIDAAVLDISLVAEDVFPLADLLQENGVPFLFITGFGSNVLPKRFRKVDMIRKPIAPFEVLIAVGLTVSRRALPH